MTKLKRMTIPQAADAVDLSRQIIWQWAKTGVIPADRIGSMYIVSLADVRRYAATRKARLAASRRNGAKK